MELEVVWLRLLREENTRISRCIQNYFGLPSNYHSKLQLQTLEVIWLPIICYPLYSVGI